jgi:glucose-6-phosphate-specific signal transduction histidine kinase
MKQQRIALWLQMSAVIAVIVVVGVLDWITGYEVSFYIFYIIPIAFAAWNINIKGAMVAAFLSGIVWSIADIFAGHIYSSIWLEDWNTWSRFISFIAIGWTIARIRQQLDNERQIAEKLRKAISEIKVLETFLPICAECKKIRDKEGEWQELEIYIGQHSNTQFSHGYCPECARRALEEAGINAQVEVDGFAGKSR